jgi:diadenosine tetraphosphate (Ap4A) HIT family hydrolase
MSETSPDCVFCAEASAAVWRGEHFYVLLDIAPILEGHALVCSSAHYPSTADLPGDLVTELDALCDWLRSFYMQEYGAFTLFEHGRTGHCVRHHPEERPCNHMHVHMLPLTEDLTERIDLGQRTTWRSWQDVTRLGTDIDGYVATHTPTAGRCFYPVMHMLPSHYLRTRAAELSGHASVADWNEVVRNGSRSPLVHQARAAFTSWVSRQRLGWD